MTNHHITRATALLAAAAIAGAAGVPAASARVADGGPAVTHPRGLDDMHASTALAAAEARNPQSAPVSPPSGGGLDWGDAGIGGGLTLAIVLLATGGAIGAGHRKRGARSAPTV